MLVAHLTDVHLGLPGAEIVPGIDAAVNLRRAVETLLALRPSPDLIVLTGDLVDAGSVAEYEHLRSILEPLLDRVRLLPGNHDDLTNMRRVFPDVPGLDGERAAFVVSADFRVIGLDSARLGLIDGRLDDAQLGWLDAELRSSDVATLVLMHHPPFATGISVMDDLALDEAGSEGLAAVVGRHACVERIASGHVHRACVAAFAGTIVMTVPSVVHAMHLQLDPTDEAGWKPEPPQMALHTVVDRRIVSHFLPIGDFAFHRFASTPPRTSPPHEAPLQASAPATTVA